MWTGPGEQWYWWRLLSALEKHCGASWAVLLEDRHGRGVFWGLGEVCFRLTWPGEEDVLSLCSAMNPTTGYPTPCLVHGRDLFGSGGPVTTLGASIGGSSSKTFIIRRLEVVMPDAGQEDVQPSQRLSQGEVPC